jgi:hypothetical protein
MTPIRCVRRRATTSKHDPFDGRAERKARDYEVGYGRPPKSTQFPRGRSGNPSGQRKARASFALLVRLELDKTITLGRGDNARTMTKRQVVAARLRKAMKAGDIDAIKLVMVIDEDPASEEPIDRETANRLFWKKAQKDLMREQRQWEAKARRAEESSRTQPSDVETASSGGVVALDPDEIADEGVTMSKREMNNGETRREKQDYEVGYGKPLKATRFPPGHSGHKGRRRKRSTTVGMDVKKGLNGKVAIRNVDGEPIKMTEREFAVASLVQRAMRATWRRSSWC